MKISAYSLILAALISTVIIEVMSISFPITPATLGFIAWAASPYAFLGIMAKSASTKAATLTVLICALLAGLVGVWLIVDSVFVHPDAQGSLVFVVVPALQWVFLVLVSVPLYFLSRARHS